MTNEQQRVANWMKAFGQEVKLKAEIPSLEIRKLRALLHLEETVELVNALGFEVNYDWSNFDEAFEPCLKDIADACKDIQVVTYGTEAACGLLTPLHQGYDPLFDAVMDSNWSKAWTHEERDSCEKSFTFVYTGNSFRPWIAKDENGKIIKPPSFTPPNFNNYL